MQASPFTKRAMEANTMSNRKMRFLLRLGMETLLLLSRIVSAIFIVLLSFAERLRDQNVKNVNDQSDANLMIAFSPLQNYFCAYLARHPILLAPQIENPNISIPMLDLTSEQIESVDYVQSRISSSKFVTAKCHCMKKFLANSANTSVQRFSQRISNMKNPLNPKVHQI